MVRPIIVNYGDRTFYGTREALFGLPLENEATRINFAEDLTRNIREINSEIKRPDHRLFLQQGFERIRIPYDMDEGKRDLDLVDALKDPSNNIWLRFQICDVNDPENILVNLIGRFTKSSLEGDGKTPRGFEIKDYPIPNNYIHFIPGFLYDLGEKHGTLEKGVYYDISIENYREIDKSKKGCS